MSVAEHIQLTRRFKLTEKGGANDSVTMTLESGNPYRHYSVWLYVLSATPNISVQPRFANADDGGPVAISARGAIKVFQVTMEEIRPATRGLSKHKDDRGPPIAMKSELVITNEDVIDHIEFSVYMMATATPGGA